MANPIAALLIAPFALFACWSLVQAYRTRRIGSRGWIFQADANPFGFWLVAVCHFGVLAFCVVLALHALGLVGDQSAILRIELPRAD